MRRLLGVLLAAVSLAHAGTDAQGYWALRIRIVARAAYRFTAAGATSATMRA